MDIFSIISLVGGLAFFLYGMNTMSSGLEKLAGGRLETTLKKMTSSKLKSLALGAGITIAIQSSSAMTVMLVGLVNSGIMQLGQTIGLIMGSNVGTTLTAWLLSLVGIEGGNIFIELLKPENFSLLFAFVGIILIMTSKKQRYKDIGSILIGFAVLMFGMKLMSGAVTPLADMPEFAGLLTAFENPLIAVLIGAVFTGIIQSSAASVGILQALALTGDITYGMAIPIIMGQNIGTCVTALISSIGVNKNAKRVAVVHISFNVIGTVVCLVLFYLLNAIFDFMFINQPIGTVGIALCHSVFNIATTAILVPFTNQLEKIANIVIRDTEDEEKYSFIDKRLLKTPSVAIAECVNVTAKMADLARETMFLAIDQLGNYREKQAEKIVENEQQLDTYEDKLGTYLVLLASKNLTDDDSRKIYKLLHSIGDFERIGDHALNVLDAAKELRDKNLEFSQEAIGELTTLINALKEIINTAVDSFRGDDLSAASTVEPLEEVIDRLIDEIKMRHTERLQAGKCTIQLGFIFSDILTNLERVSDHCSNIAVCVLELAQGSFATHKYLHTVKASDDTFRRYYEVFSDKYHIE